ncbi:MAG: chromosomal replication initiator protein DnaA [Solirubrobacteraceae bacterium]
MQQEEAFEEVWRRIRAALRCAVGERTYGLWLEPLQCDGLQADTLLLSGPPEVATWAAERLDRVLQACAASVLGPHVTVEVARDGPRAAPVTAAGPIEDRERPQLNPDYTFEHFVIGPSNRLAHAAALSVAELPAQAYNPLFIYGPPGLGKTHLLHSIGNYVSAFGGGLQVRYTTLESFTSEFVSALGAGGDLAEFKRRFRHVDVLLIDDVQFLERKARTEEEFFHTFNALYETGSQLVITADRIPAELKDLADRLRERFTAGLVCDIGRPDYATRLTILRKRAKHDSLPIADEESLMVIADAITGNIRTLEGALIRSVAYASLTSRPLTAELAAEVIERLSLRSDSAAVPTVRRIQEATCRQFSVSREELLSRSRDARLVWPRHVAMYLSRELTSDSLPVIGRQFGGRDHTTVMHACRRTTKQMRTDAIAFAAIEDLTRELTAQDAHSD